MSFNSVQALVWRRARFNLRVSPLCLGVCFLLQRHARMIKDGALEPTIPRVSVRLWGGLEGDK